MTNVIENPIISYYNDIQNGKIRVSAKIRKTYEYLVSEINNPGEFFYSQKRALHVIDFIEKFCKHSKGKWGGQSIELEKWEKAILATVFGFVDKKGNRRYREAVLIVGKKNGKSLLSSAIGNYLLFADGEAGPEVYAVATKKDQAKIIWDEAKRMVNKSPALKKFIKPYVSELACQINDGVFKPLASDSDTLDGLNVSGGLLDEIHQWKNGAELYDIIVDGITARDQPLIFITSTAGYIREDLYDERYEYAEKVIKGYCGEEGGIIDDHFIAFIYELDRREQWTDPACWQMANPGLGTIKSLEQLTERVKKAQNNPRYIKNVLCKDFNIRETNKQAWLDYDTINNVSSFDISVLKPTFAIGGADLSSTTDLTAASYIFKLPGSDIIYVKSMYWLPEELLEKRVNEDKIPYDLWAEQGLLRLSPGNRVDKDEVADWFYQEAENYGFTFLYIGYDAWSSEAFVKKLNEYFSPVVPVAVHQGKKTLSSPMKSLGADLESKKIIYNNNPITKWCMCNTAYEEDKNGNIQPCKTSKPTRRIDGLAALLDAYTVLENNIDVYENMIA